MAIRNPDWYAANATRLYPLDEKATGVDDAGQLLPSDILVDINLRFPQAAGRRAVLSSLSVTPHIVTATFVADNNDLNDGPEAPATPIATFVPLATISIPQPVDINRNYPLESVYPGAGGWIAFGSGADGRQTYRGLFSTAKQGLLLTRLARSYPDSVASGIPFLRHAGTASRLTGLVQLKADNNIEIEKVNVLIENLEDPGYQACRPAIMISLKSSPDINIYEEFVSPCLQNPENGNCSPAPLEFINGVTPDCDGNIELVFTGDLDVFELLTSESSSSSLTPRGGLELDHNLGLPDVCPDRANLPGENGELTDDEGDICPPDESSDWYAEDPESPDPPSNAFPYIVEFPYYDTFDYGIPEEFREISGSFGLGSGDSPLETDGAMEMVVYDLGSSSSSASENVNACLETLSSTRNNLSYFLISDLSPSAEMSVSVDCRLLDTSVQQNAMVIIHMMNGEGPVLFFSAEIDKTRDRMVIRRWTSTTDSTVIASTGSALGLKSDTWYRLVVTVDNDAGYQVIISATLSEIDEYDTLIWMSTLTSPSQLGCYDAFGVIRRGYWGVGSRSSHAQFSWFHQTNV